ncbi:hypothetical protein A2982_01900 [candidate division WWE3 bacterium RIFCSPLOWO2_01_FULL_39_13]|uniref:Uncharacterized protein n=1 Tax=candidate division WWE3 bacterium RIFCSPLOWO2_01_FULL_39_13 TaxID=1802624 RepID=A0A1F4V587_UNCKA|nr:MAG: hypothetical protein A2982_01900 [candidate division WWE3 bacterium RIFCSPLOWO2_01_FULL_39_13]
MKKIDKDLLINPFPLSDRELEEIKNIKTTSLTEMQINEAIYFIDLCDNVASKYPDRPDTFEWAVRGLRDGLMNYRDSQLTNPERSKLATYLTYFMKESIETAIKETKAPKKQDR